MKIFSQSLHSPQNFLSFLIIIKHFINRNNLLFCVAEESQRKSLEKLRSIREYFRASRNKKPLKLNGMIFLNLLKTKKKAIYDVMRKRFWLRFVSRFTLRIQHRRNFSLSPPSTLIVPCNVLFFALSWLFIFLVMPKNYFIIFFVSLYFCFEKKFAFGATTVKREIERCISKDFHLYQRYLSYDRRKKPFYSAVLGRQREMKGHI